jgi:hypothetical protein
VADLGVRAAHLPQHEPGGKERDDTGEQERNAQRPRDLAPVGGEEEDDSEARDQPAENPERVGKPSTARVAREAADRRRGHRRPDEAKHEHDDHEGERDLEQSGRILMPHQAILTMLLGRYHAAPEPTHARAKARSLGAVECGLWRGASDREPRQHHLMGH